MDSENWPTREKPRWSDSSPQPPNKLRLLCPVATNQPTSLSIITGLLAKANKIVAGKDTLLRCLPAVSDQLDLFGSAASIGWKRQMSIVGRLS
jgi:hypothetical protein